jgi:hypothetical protein
MDNFLKYEPELNKVLNDIFDDDVYFDLNDKNHTLLKNCLKERRKELQNEERKQKLKNIEKNLNI